MPPPLAAIRATRRLQSPRRCSPRRSSLDLQCVQGALQPPAPGPHLHDVRPRVHAPRAGGPGHAPGHQKNGRGAARHGLPGEPCPPCLLRDPRSALPQGRLHSHGRPAPRGQRGRGPARQRRRPGREPLACPGRAGRLEARRRRGRGGAPGLQPAGRRGALAERRPRAAPCRDVPGLPGAPAACAAGQAPLAACCARAHRGRAGSGRGPHARCARGGRGGGGGCRRSGVRAAGHRPGVGRLRPVELHAASGRDRQGQLGLVLRHFGRRGGRRGGAASSELCWPVGLIEVL
mmetsp:Transcript_125687/g.350125  ORF Transcript_125687/g.350125 Transcript_125687/m.350125 type:complete len:290 (-) Transcript_125687:375-1244(-)